VTEPNLTLTFVVSGRYGDGQFGWLRSGQRIMSLKLMRAGLSALAFAGFIVGLAAAPERARALSIELKDVAADRVDRQRAAAEGALPLPGTPNVAMLNDRLREKAVSLSAPIVIRIFKMESELEIWKEKNGSFTLFATYPICHWSGSLGPKLRQGDKQAPEGFYTLTKKQLHHSGRWPQSLLINFPNIYDQAEARTGSDILIHGGCTSVGCFAMTNPVSDEIYRLTSSAIDGGQDHVPVHIFPFRMTDENMKAQATPAWSGFWMNLKEGFDAFERTKRALRVTACDGRYAFNEATGSANTGPVEACGTTIANIKEQDQWLAGVPAAAAPVRTAAADFTATDASRESQSLTDGEQSEPVEPAAESAGAIAAEPPVFRCRYAIRACRKTATLDGLLAGKRAMMLSSGLRRLILQAHPEQRAERMP